jgi:NAD(P)-dependent dehydrogenase (short-subunit alcohol dehydrogenase family)/rhamnose utilization protein RhaD (predicted bifunctional aldolase and dehydrogenase)
VSIPATGSAAGELRPETDASVARLIALAQHFGLDPEFSRGGGGNASVKVEGTLWIKPSGVPLATLQATDLVPLDRARLLSFLDQPPDVAAGEDPVIRAAELARLGSAHGPRPSVELLFHALLDERMVLHTHPILINAVTCNRDGEAIARRLFGDDVVWVHYTDPGLPLARAVRDARAAHTARTGRPAPGVILMQNHGLIVTGDDPDTIKSASHHVAQVIGDAIDAVPAGWSETTGDPQAISGAVHAVAPTLRTRLSRARRRIVVFDDAPGPAAFTATEPGRAFMTGGPLTPDQIVYAGSFPLVIDVDGVEPDDIPDLVTDRLDAHVAAGRPEPIVTVVPGVGLFAAGDTWADADTARHIYLDALRVGDAAVRLGGVRHLADSERRFIETWEAEAYRRQVHSGDGTPGRVAGRIALVTGAAQGFGLAIAEDLVAQGAHVILADLNAPLAEANATALSDRFGAGRAIAVAMDVTDDASVEAGVRAAVRAYGGLDILVSNAGVLRAGGVTSQPVAEFDLVTRVNYRGYFLVVKHVAPVMARQHAVNPDWWGDIIEINSKSGLAGSSRNSAYAGSKFGGIGLTQSFALELVGDGIKVNAICPGNFLDGPLWSDPDNGLFVQYLREGKVPGATSVADVRHYYAARVPMGRGCTPADVMEALYYLVAQRYETGQALPVTGGQVMLS